MSAQYRPYRDEEDVPPEERAWVDDGPSGRIQIYEKTTHDIHHVVTQRHLVMAGCSIAVIAGLLGLCVGYFAHTEHAACIPGRSVALFSVYDENTTVKSLLNKLIPEGFSRTGISDFTDGATDQEFVEEIEGKWRKLDGVEVTVDEFNTSIPHGGDQPNTIEIVLPDGTVKEKFELKLSDKEFSYVAFAASGTAEGKLMYASRLNLNDSYILQQNRVENGTILLARFGAVPLREQIQRARNLKAAGLLLYQDPAEYPGADYHLDAIPRICAPLADGVYKHESLLNAESDASPESESSGMLVQAISGNLAKYLLQQLSSSRKTVSVRMAGSLKGVTYTSGPSSDFILRVTTRQRVTIKKRSNVFGVIRGRVEPDRYVLIGAGRDTWSPSSVAGTAALQELIGIFSGLVSKGWRPRRTIVFCSFAAEHLNSAGLNHFLHSRMNILRGRSVVYVDITYPVLGFSTILPVGSPILSQALYNASSSVLAAKSIGGNNSNSVSLYSEWLRIFPQNKTKDTLDLLQAARASKQAKPETFAGNFLLEPNNYTPNQTHGLFNNYLQSALVPQRPTIRFLDYTDGFASFLTLAGIPVIQASYVSENYLINQRMNPKPAWFRTQFDSLNKTIRGLSEPDNRYHLAIGRFAAELVRDFADSLFLPFNLLDYAVTLQSYYYGTLGHYSVTSHGAQDRDIFKPLQDAVNKFTHSALEFHARQDRLDLSDPMMIRLVNDQLLLLERAFLSTDTLSQLPVSDASGNLQERHGIIGPPRTYPRVENVFPNALDLMAIDLLTEDNERNNRMAFLVERLTKVINNAAITLREVELLFERTCLSCNR